MSVLTILDDTIWIDLPDGRQLSARLWLPKTGHSYPVIFEYLPYRKRDGTAKRDATTHAHFVKHGYASILVDIAGTGDSYGQFDDEYSEQELTDGEAVLDWISSQDWCDGSIGMIGISWGGFNALKPPEPQQPFRQQPQGQTHHKQRPCRQQVTPPPHQARLHHDQPSPPDSPDRQKAAPWQVQCRGLHLLQLPFSSALSPKVMLARWRSPKRSILIKISFT